MTFALFEHTSLTALFVGNLGVLLLNVYGRTRTMRFRDFSATPEQFFRFGREHPLSYAKAMAEINELSKIEDQLEYAIRATEMVNQSLAHLEWNALDPIKSHQTIPFWENPVLYMLGRYSGLAYYERYNFTSYKRTLERGFGICGDASMVLSQLLDKKAILHNIIAFKGHVLVEAFIKEKCYTLDPDFGVYIKYSIKRLASDSQLAKKEYLDAGFPESDAASIAKILTMRSFRYGGVYEFVPKRYILERISYCLFWYGPLAGLALSLALSF